MKASTRCSASNAPGSLFGSSLMVLLFLPQTRELVLQLDDAHLILVRSQLATDLAGLLGESGAALVQVVQMLLCPDLGGLVGDDGGVDPSEILGQHLHARLQVHPITHPCSPRAGVARASRALSACCASSQSASRSS